MAIARLSPRLLRAASDERLVALTRAGSDAAFEAIYDRHHRQLLSFCRHMLGSHAEGEDALQQTFLSAHRALLASEQPVQLRAWLHTIARNRCISMLRARREQPAAEPIDVATVGLAEEVQGREDLRDLLADLAELPDTQRAALVLAELGALSHDEIAGVLGVPRMKVKALVFQARESLIASRHARDADCREIREQLATLTGSGLRRGPLRRHLAVCAGCRDYKSEVVRQRSALALVLPVVPSAALRHAVLSGGAAGGRAGAGGGLLAAAGKGVGVKAAVAAAVAATAAGTVIAVDDHTPAHADAPEARAARHSTARRAAVRAPGEAPRAAAQPHRAPATRRQQPVAARPHPRHAPTPATRPHPALPAASTPATSPGAAASTPSRAGATPAHANPTPGVPRGKARGHAKIHPAKPVKVKAPKPVKVKPAKPVKVHPAKPAKPVKVHPAKPAKPTPSTAATKPHGHAAATHGKGHSDD